VEDPEVVVVGGGIAGASIAAVLARAGKSVLVLERQFEYGDRVRGEFMALWGVLEVRALGLEETIRGTNAVDGCYQVPFGEQNEPSAAEGLKSDSSTILAGVNGPLFASHPRSCQALADEASSHGAEVVRGVSEVRVKPGVRPSVVFRCGAETEVRPRLVIGADGRTSSVREQAGISVNKSPSTHVIAGLLVENAMRWPGDEYCIGVEGDILFYVFPQGSGHLRLYTCLGNDQAKRWAGRDGPKRFLEAFAKLRSIPTERGLGDVRQAGPCATFSCEPTWCSEPYVEGVVLVGDAGGYDDPVDGQGLSLAMSDVRSLSELLLGTDDWTRSALRPYGEQRTERLRRMRRLSTTYAALMTTFSPEGRARRDRYRAAMKGERDDIRMALAAVALGPDRLPPEAFSDHLHESLLA
jgi:2-polyprenyl-6-methoxyphenol hydroxylase-like FAD-dependent oxidoreductase